MFRTTAAACLMSFVLASHGAAGDQYVDPNGFAVSGFDVVSYFSLTQGEPGQPQPDPQVGHAAITADYNGATFAFATPANRAAFLADPARYVPQYDGHCAYGVAKGGKVPGNPTLWRIVDGKLYLNITPAVVGYWEKDIPGNLGKSESNWSRIESDAASTAAIPQFSSPAPVRN